MAAFMAAGAPVALRAPALSTSRRGRAAHAAPSAGLAARAAPLSARESLSGLEATATLTRRSARAAAARSGAVTSAIFVRAPCCAAHTLSVCIPSAIRARC
jgi:hypothetical protein